MAYSPPRPGSKIIIVGGGCFGLSTAYALSLKQQYDIYVFDRRPIPCPDAASTGKQCIFFMRDKDLLC
jgi:sarcosine oxidase/L-pipecolate oxidase